MKKLMAMILALFVGIIALGLLGGCSSNNSGNSGTAPATGESKNPAIRFATIVSTKGYGFWYGYDNGIFDKIGLKIDMVTLEDTTRVSAFSAGDVDIAEINTSQAIVAAGKGAPFKIVASMYRTVPAWYLVSNASISKIEDLKGKKIGVTAFGTGLDVAARVILKAHGIDASKDVTMVALGGVAAIQMAAALKSGQVDAVMTANPTAYMVEKDGSGKVLAKVADYLPLLHTGVIVASNKIIKEHPELVSKFIDGYFEANKYAKQHLDSFAQYVATNNKVNLDVSQGTLKMDLGVWDNKPKINLQALEYTQNIQIELGFQNEKYDVNKIVDLQFIPNKNYE